MTPLRVTSSTMQTVVRMCRLQSPSETCGFIVASREKPDLGSRVVWMQNMAEKPHHTYVMDNAAVQHAYAEFDQAGEDVLAVFHSHPASPAEMSQDDLANAVDTSVIYLVVSLAGDSPKARAFTVEHFIGNPIAHQVPIQVFADEKPPPVEAVKTGPWALTPGNYVRIEYQRTNKKPLSVNVARVIDCDEEAVRLDPDHKTAAKQIPLERIRSIHVLEEGVKGAVARARLRAFAGEAVALLAGPDLERLPALADALTRAFPRDITVSMSGPR